MNGIRAHYRTTWPRDRDRNIKTRAGAAQCQGPILHIDHGVVISRNSPCEPRRNRGNCWVCHPIRIAPRIKRGFNTIFVSHRHRPAERVLRISCINRDLMLVNNGLLRPARQYHRNTEVKHVGATQHGEPSL